MSASIPARTCIGLAERCHVNYVVTDSDWEAELARVLESHKQVRSYVKNQGLQFEVPYRAGSTPRKYLPDSSWLWMTEARIS